jgi:hypothetical protein
VRVAQELARVKGFNKLLDQVGHQEDLYEIFVDATEDLLVQVSQAIAAGSYDESFLVNAFNDEYNSNAMITHFRVSRSPPFNATRSFVWRVCRDADILLFLVDDQLVDEITPRPIPSVSFSPSRCILRDHD